MTSFCPHLVRSILTSFVILPFLIYLVRNHSHTFPLLIVHRTQGMSFHHMIMKRINISFLLHPICHLSFSKTQRIKIYVSHQPLYMIRQIKWISMYIPNFLIVVVMISSTLHLVMIFIHFLLIFPNHQYLMSYLQMK